MNFISYLNYRKDVIFISIRQAKNNECTKDGRSWYVDLTYRDLLGKRCRYHSKKFATRREAKDHEAEFKVNIKNQTEFTDLTFKIWVSREFATTFALSFAFFAVLANKSLQTFCEFSIEKLTLSTLFTPASVAI